MAGRVPSTKVSNPPGGVSSIFGGSDPSAETPRKVRDNQKSSLFGVDQVDSAKRNFASPRHQHDTKNRLFGEIDSGASPRRVTDTYRSNVIFSASVDCLSDELKRTPKRSTSSGVNPITGASLASTPSQEMNGFSLDGGLKNGGGTNGHSARENGHCNGENGGAMDHHQNGENGQVQNGDSKMRNGRQPPGGKSSGIF